MKIRVNQDQCQGHALCAMTAPNVYDLDSEGFNSSNGADVPAELLDDASRGAAACPERAIGLADIS